MTNSELVTLIQDQLKGYSTSIFPATLVREWMDEGQIDIVRRTGCVTTTGTINVTASTREYSMPSDILKVKHVYYYDGTNYLRLHQTTLDELETYFDFPNESAGTPTHYYIKMAGTPTIGLYPKPDTTVANAISVYYVQRPSTLTTAATNPAIPEPYHRLIALYAMWRLLQKDVKDETADRYQALYEQQMQQMSHDMKNWDRKQRLRMRPYGRDQRDRYPAWDLTSDGR